MSSGNAGRMVLWEEHKIQDAGIVLNYVFHYSIITSLVE